jgi:hypothetical protein
MHGSGLCGGGGKFLYAIHIPDNTKEQNKEGAKEFVTFVTSNDNKTKKGRMYCFVNGENRATTEEEAKYLRSKLNKPDTWVYRIKDIKDSKSIAIMVKWDHTDLDMRYKVISHPVGWKEGGVEKSGQYQKKSAYSGATVPEDLVAGWIVLGNDNCTIATIK